MIALHEREEKYREILRLTKQIIRENKKALERCQQYGEPCDFGICDECELGRRYDEETE